MSEKRAQSAKKYLTDKFGIAENRLALKGYGSTKPIADNKTEEGRSKNRRAEFRIIP
jgi:outer membrane protein OmpA-like peptidoglycan-associated protein